jgi:RNA polymerase sigma-70 factor (ECF subfamily)
MDRLELERELERLHPASWGWALACCDRDRQLAEDVLQTAYLRVLSGAARYRGGSSLKTWIFGVVRLVAFEERRRRQQRVARETADDTIARVADPSAGADVVTESRARREALLAALSTLSARQREVLLLVFYHDLTIDEAAAVMLISIGSARTHYERGKKALARQLLNGAYHESA